MADTRPTPVSFLKAIWLCMLLLFHPQRFIAEETKDITARKNYTDINEPVHRAYIIRRAFIKSLIYVLGSAAIGYMAVNVVHKLGRCSTADTITWLQVVGASLLLWGTLFVRGWEIQSFSGVLFSERVNQWLYRFLYCIGTAIIVYSLAFPLCVK